MAHNGDNQTCHACHTPIDPLQYVKAGNCYFHSRCYMDWVMWYELNPVTLEWVRRQS